MLLLYNKSQEDLNVIAMERLKQSKINFIGPGGVARLLLNIINENIEGFYKALQVNHTQAFLSTAKGEFLEAIGYMLSCTKLPSEDDDTYRERISQQVLSAAAANMTSIRLAALSVEGVQSVVLKPFTYGTGSFDVFIIAANIDIAESLIIKAKSAIDETVGYGIKFNVSGPKLVPVDIQVKLMFRSSTDDATKQLTKTKVKEALKAYINSRSIGEPLIINEITQRVMEVDDEILNYQLVSLKVKNKRVMTVDQNCRWNERFIESSNPDAITVT